MQITSSNWQNPAAHAQQSASHTRTPHATTSPQSGGGVDALEHAAKTGDRDANERYDGPPGQSSAPSAPDEDEQTRATLLSLPADDGQQPELDIRG